MNQRVEKAFNDQINEELFSAYMYLAMAAHFKAMNLDGFASWMRHQADEEVEHGMRLFTHINRRGGRVVLKAIGEPPLDFGSPLEAFQKALAHEQHITGTINALYEVAVEEKDYPAQMEIQWFIDEQVEEEATAEDILNQITMVDAKPGNLFYIDRHIVRQRES